MTNFTLARNGLFASVFLSLLTLLASSGQLPAAITPTGNVEPSGTWTTSTVGYIGHSTDGTLAVNAGSLLNSSTAYIANNSGVNGLATITGSGSKWTNTYGLYLGYYGSGTMSVEAGGNVLSYASYLGYYAKSSGSATIIDANSQWTNRYELNVGYYGNGTLSIEAGGYASCLFGCLGRYAGSSGTAIINGSGSTWINDDLTVGSGGTGVLRIEAGGQVEDYSGLVGGYSGSTGTVTITGVGSLWENRGSLYINRGGTLTVSDGGKVTAATLYASLGNLKGNGTISVTQGAVLDADLYFDAAHGTHCTVPFGSEGVLTINAAYYGTLGAGFNEKGSLTVTGGRIIDSSLGYLGYNSGSSGIATVTGMGSKWIARNGLFLGKSGIGDLTVTDSGYVWAKSLFVGYNGTGALTVTNGGKVGTDLFFASLANLSGNGTIIAAKGAVLDADLRFDAAHPTQNTFSFGSGGTLKVTMAGGSLGAGYHGNGSLTIAEGVTITSTDGCLGYFSGSLGTATVTGAGSNWIISPDSLNNNIFYIGNGGTGTMNIEAGGQVSFNKGTCYFGYSPEASGTVNVTGSGSKWINDANFYIGYCGTGTLRVESGGVVSSTNSTIGLANSPSARGMVIVTGAGSNWTNSEDLSVGAAGIGTMHIRDGGTISTGWAGIYYRSLLTIDAGYGSVLSVSNGAGSISYSGTIRFVTGPQPTVGSQYSPIAAATWTSNGTYQALGGTWNTSSHIFTVSQALAGVSGTPVAVDLAQQQRVLIGESSLNRTVGASFLAKTGTDKTFNLTAIALADVPALGGLLQPWESVFNAWTFTAEGAGYVATDPVYLSFSVPANMSRDKVKLWKLTGDTWSAFSADDLTVTGGYASFTSTGLSGYAVTVPEPAAIALLITAIMGGLLVWRRQR